jgi:hypothetical protein
MIMPTERDLMAKKEYYKDQIRAAQRHNLACQAMAGQESTRFYVGVLGWLGQRLVTWGTSLQDTYTTVSSPVPQSR